jgi:hypothetical protein
LSFLNTLGKGSKVVEGTVVLTRDVSETSQLEKSAFANLKYEGEVSGGGRSGGAVLQQVREQLRANISRTFYCL